MHKNISRKLLCIGCMGAVSLMSASVFADLLYDCSLAVNDSSATLDHLSITSWPLSKDDRSTAMSNLKAYCCQQWIMQNGCESVSATENNPESPYIFDQLVSQGFFKLDNKLDGNSDTKGKERKEKLTSWEESGKWVVPVVIQSTFVESRQPTKRQQAQLNTNTCDITNYESLDMSARYTAVCLQSACITSTFLNAVWDLDQRYDETNCEAMARQRIDNEMSYVQTLMVQKTNTLMEDTWKTYTQSYMLETRRTTLLEKFSHINDSFSTVTNKVQEGTKMCSVG